MHLIITRPQADSDRLKTRLETIGYSASVVPLLTIQIDQKATIPDKPWQAIAITSANALTPLTAAGLHQELQSVPVFAVGPASAKLARETGFADVRQADGDLAALQTQMQNTLDAKNGPILYLTGKVRSGDLAAALQAVGFDVDRIELYDAVAATQLPSPANQMIRSGKADGVVLYSARTADIWVRLVRQSRLGPKAERLIHFCLSRAVAQKITAGLGRNVPVVISAKPNDDAMLEKIAATATSRTNHKATPGKGATMANRKTPSRKAKKPARPTVIDAKATEVKSTESAKPAGGQDQKPDAEPVDKDAGKASAKPDVAGKAAKADNQAGKAAASNASKNKSTAKPASRSSSPPEKSSGRGRLLAGALAVTLLAGVAAGGYLYREHGARLFGPDAPAFDVDALQNQAGQAIGTAQSASDTASNALAQTQALTEKIAGLEQQLGESRDAVPAPDPEMQATIKAASELAGSAKSDVAALSARTGEIEAAISEIRQSVTGLKSAWQSAADSGGGAGQAEINLRFDELARRIDKLAAEAAVPDQTGAGEISTLRDQLAAANARIEKLEAAEPSSGNADVAGDVSALGEQLSAATTRINDLESRLAEALARAKSEAESAAEAQPAVLDTGRIARQMTALSDMVNQGKPYQAELAALQETANLTLNLPALSANADTGVMTVSQLKQSLADLKTRLDEAAAAESAGAETSSGLWGTITGKLSSVVKVRKVAGGTDWVAHVAAAVTALETGGLDTAIAALDRGGTSAPADVSGWIIEARKRLSAGEELQKLPQIILGHLPAPAQ